MMLDNCPGIPKRLPKHLCGLVNNACIGNGINDALEAMMQRVLQRESEA